MLSGYTAENPPPVDLVAALFRQRMRAELFHQLDSDALTLTKTFDLVNNASHADGGTINPADCNRAEGIPVIRLQIRGKATKAEALAAIEDIKAAIAGQFPG